MHCLKLYIEDIITNLLFWDKKRLQSLIDWRRVRLYWVVKVIIVWPTLTWLNYTKMLYLHMLGQFYPYQLPANWHILHLMLLLRKEFSGTRKHMFSVYSWYIFLHILVHRRISATSYYYTFAVSLLLFIYIMHGMCTSNFLM